MMEEEGRFLDEEGLEGRTIEIEQKGFEEGG